MNRRPDRAIVLLVALVLAVVAVLAVSSCGGGGDAQAVSTQGPPPSREYLGMVDVKYNLPANNVRYPCGSLDIPAGTYRLSYRVMAFSSRPQTDTGTVSAFAELSGAGPVAEWTTGGRAGGGLFRGIWTLSAERVVTFLADTTVTLSIYESEGNNWSTLQCLGERSWTIIRAEAL